MLAHGERLARGDGLLYLGSCAPSCNDATALQHGGVTFVKCASRCTHAFAARSPMWPLCQFVLPYRCSELSEPALLIEGKRLHTSSEFARGSWGRMQSLHSRQTPLQPRADEVLKATMSHELRGTEICTHAGLRHRPPAAR